jgi:hypothetical protein
MVQLLGALARQLQRVVGRLLRFLDERVDDDEALGNRKTLGRPTNARPAAGTKLEPALAKGPGVR